MLVGPTRASFLGAVVSAFLVGALVPACSPASLALDDGGASASSVVQPACPASFAAVASASCSLEGQACPYLVPCPTLPSNATCVCTGGSFVCTGFGDAGTSCPTLTMTQSCPLSERSASGLFCSDLGLICTYKSACPGIPTFDSCQCVGGNTADEQSHFECNMPCILAGDAAAALPPTTDASAPDAMGSDDARAEPPMDAAPAADGGGASDL
jgi:hypothetical protein